MDLSLERDSSALGSLFQQIINDMKNTSPLWEDFVAKASKLHTCLRAAIQAIAAYLDAFQKIADAATNSRGASKEIGTALTRVCLRHKAVETRLKTFTSAIMDCLVQPLQDKIEDWKRTVATIDKDHAKEYKRCRSELKKRSSDTLRLQKKARKGQTDNSLQSLMDSHMQDVTLRRAELEEVEKKSLRAAMVEERLRFCSFVHMLQPVVHEECEVMSELGHLQEAMESIALVTKEPTVLPQASEELIHDAKASINLYPESPGGGSGSQGGGCSNSLGSRKSSVCSISSMNSSGSSNSPGHHHYQRSLSQFVTPAIRLKPGESSDSGFCSSPALTTQASTATNQTHAVSTWPPHSQDAVDTLPPTADRPHTISTTYEKGHQRPPLTVYTFQNPETIHESSSSGSLITAAAPPAGAGAGAAPAGGANSGGQTTPAPQKSPAASLSRPPLPVRCSSLERPLSAQSNHRQNSGQNLLQRQCPSPIPAHITKELSAAHHAQQQQQQQTQQQQQQQQTTPTYVNMSELAAMKLTNQQQQHQQQQSQQQQQQSATPLLQQQSSIDSISSQHSNDSSTSSLQQQLLQHQQQQQQQLAHMNHHQQRGTRSHSISSSVSSNTASSLHSHPSIDSAVVGAAAAAASNTTPSSGCSTPQNHYSPLLTNSPTSTAAGTPSNGSIASGLGFVYQVSSPTPPASAAPEVLKITEASSSTTPDTDERSRASVLQKASMFEKQAAAAAAPPPPPVPAAAAAVAVGPGTAGRRAEELRAVEQQEMDKSFEDSIQALNNLIGELDSFQREIDEGKGKQHSSNSNSNSNSNINNSSSNNVNNNNNSGASSSSSSNENNNTNELLLLPGNNIDCCAISNQTNSSGCGTDISDTTSEELGAGDGDAQRQRQLGASDSELSRCYVSETSSLTGGLLAGGYENPTFAHFASREDRDADMAPRHAYVDSCSDGGSAVVVIYDHQIPNTPDIEFAKQNSEIVLMRTKDPQQLQLHEMRELQQLPDNLAGSPESPDGIGGSSVSTATVAPAKQRLSSFRASSEQQLQLLGRASPHRGTEKFSLSLEQQQPQLQQQQQQKQSQQLASDSSNIAVRRPLPPKPISLSIFNETGNSNCNSSSSSSNKPVIPRKFDFKADLDAKIRKQKLKVQQQLQQQQQQQQQEQQQHSPTTPATTNSTTTTANCNITKPPALIASASASASASVNSINNNNINHSRTATSNHSQSYTTATSTISNATATIATKLTLPASGSSSTSSSSSSTSTSSPTSTSLATSAAPALLPTVPAKPNANSFVCPTVNAHATIPATVKPCITPRPASLSGGGGGGGLGAAGVGSTRIARRSSINQAKPPPPVRRSSSVTPSVNNGSYRTTSPCAAGAGSSIYAQPKIVSNMSSFRSSSPSPNGHAHALPPTQPKANPNLIAQLNARLNSKQQQQQQQQQQHQQQHVAEGIYGNAMGSESIYMRSGLSMQQQQQQQQQQYDDYATSTNIEKTGSIRAKTKAEFLENLNAKLAKQGMSGRAFAVRNLINSKALPDPRICHESLMDQIKRGATLKRNQKINDRSAPKIH
ncbi:pneumococcal serine-rich repeat protein isoform X23 [Drosophila mojavensis]|uniref:pneumococcal serine-rich repeat protein isoform X23 n=1 Tax=Drosophila mojavensis TaxID=7230 RepID=UPI0013EEBCE2|nr:pneumococcal serine-rich repeat protein isoform X23 [Drosophila mojavensis]